MSLKKKTKEPIPISSEKEFKILKTDYHSEQTIFAICSVCGNQNKYYNCKVKNWPVVCNKCRKNKELIEKYGSVEEGRRILNAESAEKRKATNIKKYGVEFPLQFKEFKQKAENTTLENFGVKCSLQSEKVREKGKTTLKNKYGAENYQQSEKAKNCKKYNFVDKPKESKIEKKYTILFLGKEAKLADLKSVCGIYSIKNIISNELYIGSSTNIGNRFKGYIVDTNTGYIINKLTKNLIEFGLKNFIFSAIELCSREKLLEREQFYIDKLRPALNSKNAISTRKDHIRSKANAISGIYKITNLATNEFYIGSSKNIESRWAYHKAKFKSNEETSNKLYLDFKKFGLENFKFEILEKCSENLKEKEQEYIDKLNPQYNRKAAHSDKIYKIDELKRKNYIKDYYNKICEYNGHRLRLKALATQFTNLRVKHPFTEARKYIVNED